MLRIINKQTGMFLRDDFTFNEETEIGLEVNPAQGFYHPKWDGEKWVEGATAEEIEALNIEIVPEKISSRQLRYQLILQGFNLETIEQALNQLPEPNRSLAKVDWEYATNFYRNNAMIVAVGQLLQLTEEQIDNIFIQGALL